MLLVHPISVFPMKIYINHRIFLSSRQCSICKKMLQPPACTISEIDRDLVFIKSSIFIPKGSRCCEQHVFQGRLRPDAYNAIRAFQIINTPFSSTDVIVWFDIFRNHYNSFQCFDFDVPFSMSDVDCYN